MKIHENDSAKKVQVHDQHFKMTKSKQIIFQEQRQKNKKFRATLQQMSQRTGKINSEAERRKPEQNRQEFGQYQSFDYV